MDKVYDNFLSFEYKPTQKRFIENLSINVNITTTTTATTSASTTATRLTTTTTDVGTTDSDSTTTAATDIAVPKAVVDITKSNYKRFFISLMSESLIKKGVFFRLRKRLRVKNDDINMYKFLEECYIYTYINNI